MPGRSVALTATGTAVQGSAFTVGLDSASRKATLAVAHSEMVKGRPLLIKSLLNLRDGTASIDVARHVGGKDSEGGARVELATNSVSKVNKPLK